MIATKYFNPFYRYYTEELNWFIISCGMYDIDYLVYHP